MVGVTIMQKYYQDDNGTVYAYDSQSDRDSFGPAGLTEMTGEQVNDHLNKSAPGSVPIRVTMRQARLALHAAGLLSQVEAAIDSLPEPPRTSARIEWDYSSEVFRERDFVTMLGASLGLTSEQMDDLFITAATL